MDPGLRKLDAIARALADDPLCTAELETVRRMLDPEAAGREFEPGDPIHEALWLDVNATLAGRYGIDPAEMPGRCPWSTEDV